jgi:uncharacterized protein YrrD
MVLEKGTPVIGSDGEEIGDVVEVLADRQKDIFSGIVVKSGLFSDKRVIPADAIEEMTTEAVRVGIPASEADKGLETYP